MKKLPDFQIGFNQFNSFITSSALTKKAFEKPPFSGFSNIVNEIIKEIDRLSQNCHIAEFTDYSLPHICSMIERISTWGSNDGWLKKLKPKEAGYLLLTVLVHDMGMLSQNPEDIKGNNVNQFCKGLADAAFWIKNTHLHRLEGFLKKLSKDNGGCLKAIIKNEHLKVIIALAKAHQSWPWQPEFESVADTVKSNIAKSRKNPIIDPDRAVGLAAVIAVANLLDEVDNHYVRAALTNRYQGTLLNKVHWLRHELTANRVDISEKIITVNFIKPKGSDDKLGQVYNALRNHYRLVRLYRKALGAIDAEIDTINFDTLLGIPEKEWSYAETWLNIQEWVPCPSEQLLKTFSPEARNEINAEESVHFTRIGLEELDLTDYYQFIGQNELITEEEMLFSRLYNYKV